MAKNKSKVEKVKLLCTGSVILQNNYKGISFNVLDDDGNETSRNFYFSLSKSTRRCNAGMVYDAEMEENSMSGLNFSHQFHDDVRRGAIQIASSGVDTAYQAANQARKAELNDDAIYELLKPLRDAYKSTNYQGRSALIARVITLMQKL